MLFQDCFNVESVNCVNVQSATTTKQPWKKFPAAYDEKRTSSARLVIENTYINELENCESVENDADKIITTAFKLNNIGFEVEDEWVVTIFLKDMKKCLSL